MVAGVPGRPWPLVWATTAAVRETPTRGRECVTARLRLEMEIRVQEMTPSSRLQVEGRAHAYYHLYVYEMNTQISGKLSLPVIQSVWVVIQYGWLTMENSYRVSIKRSLTWQQQTPTGSVNTRTETRPTSWSWPIGTSLWVWRVTWGSCVINFSYSIKHWKTNRMVHVVSTTWLTRSGWDFTNRISCGSGDRTTPTSPSSQTGLAGTAMSALNDCGHIWISLTRWLTFISLGLATIPIETTPSWTATLIMSVNGTTTSAPTRRPPSAPSVKVAFHSLNPPLFLLHSDLIIHASLRSFRNRFVETTL